jgi:hypothetical protein
LGDFASAIGNTNAANPLIFGLLVGDIVDQSGKIAFIHHPHGHVFGDHRPDSILAAKIIIFLGLRFS